MSSSSLQRTREASPAGNGTSVGMMEVMGVEVGVEMGVGAVRVIGVEVGVVKVAF